MMRNPRLTPYLGPLVYYPQDMAPRNRDSQEYEAIEGLIDSLPDADVWKLSVAPGLKQAGVFRRAGLKLEVQQTFLADLVAPVEDLFHSCKESLRRNIRLAEKNLRIAAEPDLCETLFEFQKATLSSKRVAQPYTASEMQQLLDACIEHNAGTLWAARDVVSGDLKAIVWNVWDVNSSYYFMGAKNPDAEDNTAMAALLWHSMLEGKRRGNTIFDFEGSMDPGVERFFRGFGARRELYLVLHRNSHWLWRMLGWLRMR